MRAGVGADSHARPPASSTTVDTQKSTASLLARKRVTTRLSATSTGVTSGQADRGACARDLPAARGGPCQRADSPRRPGPTTSGCCICCAAAASR